MHAAGNLPPFTKRQEKKAVQARRRNMRISVRLMQQAFDTGEDSGVA